jgi:ABC-type phosphonate transport system ATPase subunit
MSDKESRGEQAAEEVARRWISAMQAMADQLQRQQQTFQQMMQESMNSYIQLLNTPPFYVSQQPQEGQRAMGQTFHQASEQWMQLAQKQQQTLRQMSEQWMEQAVQQQQTFQQIVQQSLGAYTDLFDPPSR